MGKTYALLKPKDEPAKMLADILKKHHPDLVEAEAKIGLLWVTPPLDDDGAAKSPAFKVAGSPVFAQAKLATPREKALTGCAFDGVIEVDAASWDNLTPKSQVALLDHELCHFEVVCDENMTIERDDFLRPKLRIRPDDFLITGFREVLFRHGIHSVEYAGVQCAAKAKDGDGQYVFEFMREREAVTA
jgi:hypothetical protein